jgi:hypothetical protein
MVKMITSIILQRGQGEGNRKLVLDLKTSEKRLAPVNIPEPFFEREYGIHLPPQLHYIAKLDVQVIGIWNLYEEG